MPDRAQQPPSLGSPFAGIPDTLDNRYNPMSPRVPRKVRGLGRSVVATELDRFKVVADNGYRTTIVVYLDSEGLKTALTNEGYHCDLLADGSVRVVELDLLAIRA